MYFIGVDLGTSAVKLLLMEESGRLVYPEYGWNEGTDRGD